jgi:opacity protein-like surface antigen
MIRSNRTWDMVLAGTIAALGPLAAPAAAADLPVKARMAQTVFDWSGIYVGAHAGYTRDHAQASLIDPIGGAGAGSRFSGLTGGVQAGYNWVTRSGLLLGFEGDFSSPNSLTSNHTVAMLNRPGSSVSELWDYVASARGRIGYAQGDWLVYATGGLAWTGGRFINTTAAGDEKLLTTRVGWTAGAGIERASRRIGAGGWNISTASSRTAACASPTAPATLPRSNFRPCASGSTASSILQTARISSSRAIRPIQSRIAGRSMARPPSSARDIRRFVLPTPAPTA